MSSDSTSYLIGPPTGLKLWIESPISCDQSYNNRGHNMIMAVGPAGSSPSSGANVGKITAQIVALQKQANALMKQARGLLNKMKTMPAGDARDAIQKQATEISRQIKLIQQQIVRLQQEAAKAGESNSVSAAMDGVRPTAMVTASGSSVGTGSSTSQGTKSASRGTSGAHVNTTA